MQTSRFPRFLGVVLAAAALATAVIPAMAQQAPSEAEFTYRFRSGDTLIQLSRRLLLQPARWPEVQRRNGIRNPFSIRPDTPIRIPYSWLKLSPDTAVVQAVAGTVTRDGVPVVQGDVLTQGMRIETAANGSVSILFADESIIMLQKSSVLRLQRLQRVEGVSDGHSAELNLESGRIDTQVKPRRDAGRFEIVTPVAISAVRGTQFRTAFDPATVHATTETLEGTVGVAGSQGSAAVGAGFGTRVESTGSVLAPVPLLPAPVLPALPAVNTRPALRVEFPAIAQAASYRLQLAADAAFRSVSVDELNASPAFEVAVPADGRYWLRVRAVDRLGIEGRDAAGEFSQRVLPAAPVIAASMLATSAQAARFYSGGAVLPWTAPSGTTRHRLQVARDAQFGQLVSDQSIEGAAGATLRDLAPGGYFWRVAAVNANGDAGDWSQTGRFLQRPDTPVVQFQSVESRSLRLAWPMSPGERYRLQVSRDAAFERILIDTTPRDGQFVIEKPSSGTWYARLQMIGEDGVQDPAGDARQHEVPVPVWLKVLISSTVLLPLLL